MAVSRLRRLVTGPSEESVFENCFGQVALGQPVTASSNTTFKNKRISAFPATDLHDFSHFIGWVTRIPTDLVLMAQVVSRPSLTDESQASQCGVCRGQVVTLYWLLCKSECRVMIFDADESTGK